MSRTLKAVLSREAKADGGSMKLLKGLRSQFSVVRALIIRDVMLRYGRNNVGFLWVVLEPMILTAGVLIIQSMIHSEYEHGTHVISLILTGYMPLTLWRHTTNNGVLMLRRSLGVLFHRNVSVFDVFISRMILEAIGTTAALVAVYFVLLLAGLVEVVQKPGHLFASWCLLWLLGMSVTLIFAAATEADETVERFVQPLQYFTVPLSGIFFMIDWLPERAQKLISYNPIANCIEFFRDGFFGDSVVTHYDIGYTLWCVLCLFWLGLILLAYSRERLSSS